MLRPCGVQQLTLRLQLLISDPPRTRGFVKTAQIAQHFSTIELHHETFGRIQLGVALVGLIEPVQRLQVVILTRIDQTHIDGEIGQRDPFAMLFKDAGNPLAELGGFRKAAQRGQRPDFADLGARLVQRAFGPPINGGRCVVGGQGLFKLTQADSVAIGLSPQSQRTMEGVVAHLARLLQQMS